MSRYVITITPENREDAPATAQTTVRVDTSSGHTRITELTVRAADGGGLAPADVPAVDLDLLVQALAPRQAAPAVAAFPAEPAGAVVTTDHASGVETAGEADGAAVVDAAQPADESVAVPVSQATQADVVSGDTEQAAEPAGFEAPAAGSAPVPVVPNQRGRQPAGKATSARKAVRKAASRPAAKTGTRTATAAGRGAGKATARAAKSTTVSRARGDVATETAAQPTTVDARPTKATKAGKAAQATKAAGVTRAGRATKAGRAVKAGQATKAGRAATAGKATKAAGVTKVAGATKAAKAASAGGATKAARPTRAAKADALTDAGGRAYRRMPEPAEVLSAYRQTGTITGVAEHFDVPRHTAAGWARRLRGMGHTIGRP